MLWMKALLFVGKSDYMESGDICNSELDLEYEKRWFHIGWLSSPWLYKLLINCRYIWWPVS